MGSVSAAQWGEIFSVNKSLPPLIDSLCDYVHHPIPKHAATALAHHGRVIALVIFGPNNALRTVARAAIPATRKAALQIPRLSPWIALLDAFECVVAEIENPKPAPIAALAEETP